MLALQLYPVLTYLLVSIATITFDLAYLMLLILLISLWLACRQTALFHTCDQYVQLSILPSRQSFRHLISSLAKLTFLPHVRMPPTGHTLLLSAGSSPLASQCLEHLLTWSQVLLVVQVKVLRIYSNTWGPCYMGAKVV